MCIRDRIQGHEISIDEFYYDEETGACLLKKDGMKIFLSKMEKKLHSEAKYLSYINERMSFRKAIWHQAVSYTHLDVYKRQGKCHCRVFSIC